MSGGEVDPSLTA